MTQIIHMVTMPMRDARGHDSPTHATVASVGPYRLCRCALGRTRATRAASAGGSASPPQIRCRSAAADPASGSWMHKMKMRVNVSFQQLHTT